MLLRKIPFISNDVSISPSELRLLESRRQAVELTLSMSARDNRFTTFIVQADQQRDAGAWNAAESFYQQALELYPLHSGYWVQIAHCFKEQDRFHWAEIGYRNARALLAPFGDYAPHLKFVCERQGHSGHVRPIDPDREMDGLAAPVTLDDVRHFGRLLLGASDLGQNVTCSFMRIESLGELLEHIIQMPDFAAANRTMLGVVAEQWSVAKS